jgi:hypothetical protein
MNEQLEPDDLDKCEVEKCNFRKIEGYSLCETHRKGKGRYALLYHSAEIERLTKDPDFKSTHQEVAMLRKTLQTIWNQCPTKFDLVVNEPKIRQLVESIQKATLLIHKMDSATGNSLDKSSLTSLIDGIVIIISKHIKDEELIKVIGAELHTLLNKTINDTMLQKSEELSDA